MPPSIRERARKAADLVLANDKSIGPIELIVQMGFLHFSHVEQWRQKNPRFDSLEPHIQCGEKKLNQTYSEFLSWAKEKNLEPFTAQYQSASRNGTAELKVTNDGDAEREAFFRTHFRRSDLTEKQKERIEKKKNKAPDLIVFQLVGDPFTCRECEMQVEVNEMFFLEQKQPICLYCADLDHLEFLPSGDATLTRRSRKHSPLSAIVKRFNRRRKKYQRQGILVTPQAIELAHAQNESDSQQRARLREKAAVRREKQDAELVKQMQELILTEFPGCPMDEANQIAVHTAERGSGRVGRSAAGRRLDPRAIRLAVIAQIRHQHTEYDELLMNGVERQMARDQIRETQDRVIRKWKKN